MVNAGVMLLPEIFAGLFPARDIDSRGHEASRTLHYDGGAVGFVDTAPTARRSASPGTALPVQEEVPAGIRRGKRRALMLSL